MERRHATLRASVSVVCALERVLRRCVGPEGGSVLFSRDTGEVLLTRHGQRILDTLQLDHPLARTVLECVRAHAGVTGDGSKSFILLLAALLRGIRDSEQFTCPRDLANRLLALSAKPLNDIVINRVHPYASTCWSAPHHNTQPVFDLLAGGYVAGRAGISQADALTRLLSRFFHAFTQERDAADAISLIHSHFNVLHAPVPGFPFGRSEVTEGLLLSRDWSVWTGLEGRVKGVILQESLEMWCDDITVCVSAHWPLRGHEVLMRRLSALLPLQVRVMLSSVKQPEAVSHWARTNHIALLECVDPAQLDFLTHVCAVETVFDSQLVTLEHCGRVQVGGRSYARVGVACHTLVLCAPAPGLLDQIVCLCRGLFAMLRHLSETALAPTSQSESSFWAGLVRAGKLLPVGGVFELLMHHFLSSEHGGDVESRKLLAAAVLCVPRALHSHPRHFLLMQTQFSAELEQWPHRPGLREGVCLEAVPGKEQLLVSVLQCVHRLLCVENVFHCRSVTLKADDDDEDEEDPSQAAG